MRYKPWGETRYTYATTPTGYRYTSQREDSLLKLYDYNARYYDANIGRFLSADTLVPNQSHYGLTVDFHQENFLLGVKAKPSGVGTITPQRLNRYSYTLNNPIRYVDPTGHEAVLEGELTPEEVEQMLAGLCNWQKVFKNNYG